MDCSQFNNEDVTSSAVGRAQEFFTKSQKNEAEKLNHVADTAIRA